MFSRTAFFTALLFSTLCTATTLPAPPPGMSRIEATYDVKSLEKTGGTWMLPQLYVVDVMTGQPADEGSLPEPLRKFVSENRTPAKALAVKAEPGKTLLEGLLDVSRHSDHQSMRKDEVAGKRIAVFQLWADWCTGCLEEAKNLSALLKEHPMPELAWIAVEADPTKGKADVVHVKDAHALRGPHGKPVKLDAEGVPVVGDDGQLVEE
jgi:thiol-disulfide isomerase/thioredoxin